MTDIFRQKYRELNDSEKRELENIKTIAGELYAAIELNTTHNNGPTTDSQPLAPPIETNGREMALAKTKLEEAVMWAVKGLTK